MGVQGRDRRGRESCGFVDESYGPARALRTVWTARGQRARIAHRLPTLSRLSPTNSTGPTTNGSREQPDNPCATKPDSSICCQHRPEGSNPCRGIRRYRRKGRERFLSDTEIRRLAATLSAHEGERPLEVAAVRLLLLTGCRKSEVLTLRWTDYREGRLFLRDGKTGPRTVWLSRAARNILDSIERTSAWVFPARRANGPTGPMLLRSFWQRVRAEADLCDVRLHDLRHAHATFALRYGESVLAIGRLLGHANPQTTLKYTHLADAMVREAAETVGAVLEG